MNSLQGQLLISSPKLNDPNFFQTVVLLVQHNDQGAMGVILNRPLEMTIQEAWPQVSEVPCNAEGPLRVGGPCPGPLMVVHTDSACSQLEICDGIYFSTEKDAIEQLVKQNAGPIRFFINYAGWGPGQLESEIEAGGWLTTAAGRDEVFRSDDQVWSAALRLAGRRARFSGIDPKLMPDDPSLN